MYEMTFGHHVVTISVKPTATAHMEKYFMATYWKIMEHTLTGEAIGTQVISSVRLLLVLVKIQMHGLGFSFCFNMYVFQFKPVKHVLGKEAFCKYSVLFHF